MRHGELTTVLLAAVVTAGLAGCCRSQKRNGETQSASGGASSSSSTHTPATGDAAIIAEVQQNINSDTRIKSKQINVGFAHGTITLKGMVGSDQEVILAGNDALQVAGVLGVANYLAAKQFRGSPARPLPAGSDAVIAAIQKLIQSDPNVKGKIQVSFEPPEQLSNSPLDARPGTVRLTGTVATQDDLIAARNDAIKTSDFPVNCSIGVRTVDMDMDLSSPTVPAPWVEPADSDKPAIPLCPGLTIVTAISSQGDYESIKRVESIGPKGVRIKYSSEYVELPWWTDPHAPLKHFTTYRTVLTADLESAHSYAQIFEGNEHSPETVPGSTAIGTSAAVLRELKTNGESEFRIGGSSVPRKIKRVGNGPVRLRVLVDGVPVDLPAIQARGQENEFFFLDDERNPLTLKFRLGIGGVTALGPATRKLCENAKTQPGLILTGDGNPSCDLPDGGDRDVLRVIKITTRCELPPVTSRGSAGTGAGTERAMGGGAGALEKSLAETGKVDVYSIYFSFNSDAIREESEPTLKEIAELLRKHPTWKLRIAGHTDAIGDVQHNLDLSNRRAEAVKNALVRRYAAKPDRLSTTGFGKSQPKDTNDTLEGRAHNRRVELMKIQ